MLPACPPGSGLRVLAAMAMAVIVLAPRPQALEANLSMQGVDDAIVFARMAQRDARQAFHDRYVRTVSDTVRRISIVSEYRRVVLLTEEHIRLGDRNYGVRQMTTELEPWRGALEVIVELAFHPQNNYVGVPLIDVLLVPLDTRATEMPAHRRRHRPDSALRPVLGPACRPTPPWWPFPPVMATVTPRSRTGDRRLGAGPLRRRAPDRRPFRRRGEGGREDPGRGRLRLRRPAVARALRPSQLRAPSR